jgi:hypothetical protein
MLLRQLRRGEGYEECDIGIGGRESGEWLAARRLEVRLRSVCDAGRQCDGARALDLFHGEQCAHAWDDGFEASGAGFEVPLPMSISDSILFLVIVAGFGLGLAYFGVGFSSRRSKRED